MSFRKSNEFLSANLYKKYNGKTITFTFSKRFIVLNVYFNCPSGANWLIV